LSTDKTALDAPIRRALFVGNGELGMGTTDWD